MADAPAHIPAPRAFISYSWDDEEHSRWVRDLAARLRGDGVNVTLDRWHAVPGDSLPAFMERAVRENDFVIAVCTPRYKQKSDRRDGGVGYEGDIMTAEVFTGGARRKILPVLRRGTWGEAAPSWLLGKYYIDLSGDPYPEAGYENLLRTLHGATEEAPPLGLRPDFGPRDASATPRSDSGGHPPGARGTNPRPENVEEEIRAVLRPLMGDRESRRARLTRAFAGYPGLLGRISVDEAPAVFLDLLLDTLRSYGDVEEGRPAVCVLLESIAGEVGSGDRERIRRIIRDYPR